MIIPFLKSSLPVSLVFDQKPLFYLLEIRNQKHEAKHLTQEDKSETMTKTQMF